MHVLMTILLLSLGQFEYMFCAICMQSLIVAFMSCRYHIIYVDGTSMHVLIMLRRLICCGKHQILSITI
jgi:hypothetical protein